MSYEPSDHKTPSISTTRIGMLVLVPIAVVFGLNTEVWGAVTLKTWTPGETLTASDLNANFDSIKTELTTLAAPNAWAPCGVLKDLVAGGCELNAYPAAAYEYGMALNGPQLRPIDCLRWNVGLRVINSAPYMVDSDNPTSSTTALGGFMYYTGTNATNDDIPSACPQDTWRQAYWKLVGGNMTLFASQGCFNATVYCQARR